MVELDERLLNIDSEAEWTVPDVETPRGGEAHFRRYLQAVLGVLCDSLHADSAYVAISGINCGEFAPFVSVNRPLTQLNGIPTHGGNSELAMRVASAHAFENYRPSDEDSRDSMQRILIKLLGHGELFGFICLDRHDGRPYEDECIESLNSAMPLLTSLAAEENFSMRVRQIAAPVAVPADVNNFGPIYDEIVQRTVCAFACDGAILRIFDPEYQLLTLAASKGDIDANLMVDRSPGDGICGQVLINSQHSWVVGMFGTAPEHKGMQVADSDLNRLRNAGIKSFIVMRLESESSESADGKLIGTLSYFFRRQHRFSWRDVSLFRSYCQRVADAIALQRQNSKLRESYENLRVQSTMMTRVEIVQLIAHDLFHKSFNARQAVENYVERCKGTLKNRSETRTHAHLDEYAEQAVESVRKVQTALQQLRSLQSRGTEEFEKESIFELPELFEEIEETLAGALAGNKITIKKKWPAKTKIRGARSALSHIFFNLVINSIEAARSRHSTKPMAIHVSATVETGKHGERMIVQFWDEGPGIDRNRFQEPAQVFEIGKSTKENGTGTGLPVARILLTRYFRGNLTLADPTRALFRIMIPL